MAMTWGKLTVGQFLDLYKLAIQNDLEEMTKVEQAVGIVYDMTQREVEELKMGDFTRLSREAAEFLTTDKLPGKPVKVIEAGGKKFKIIYDVTQLRQRQYVEIMHFSSSPIENMHLILASIVKPIRYGIVMRNRAKDHAAHAETLLSAPVTDLYHTCVFFCRLFRNLMQHIQPSLVLEIMKKTNLSKTQVEQLLQGSMKVLDGFIQQPELPNTKE